ncbi:Uncharacterised protein [Vibrio cholerae]|nr:Uncharacterised protein [Vibrio cholerae]
MINIVHVATLTITAPHAHRVLLIPFQQHPLKAGQIAIELSKSLLNRRVTA